MYHQQQFPFNAMMPGDLLQYLEVFQDPVWPVGNGSRTQGSSSYQDPNIQYQIQDPNFTFQPVPTHQGFIAQNQNPFFQGQFTQNQVQDPNFVFQGSYERREAPGFLHEDVVVESRNQDPENAVQGLDPVYQDYQGTIAQNQVQDPNYTFQNDQGSIEALESDLSAENIFAIESEDLSKYMEILQEPGIERNHSLQEAVVQDRIQGSDPTFQVDYDNKVLENFYQNVIAQNQVQYPTYNFQNGHEMMMNQQYQWNGYSAMDQGSRPGSSGPGFGGYPVNYGIQELQEHRTQLSEPECKDQNLKIRKPKGFYKQQYKCLENQRPSSTSQSAPQFTPDPLGSNALVTSSQKPSSELDFTCLIIDRELARTSNLTPLEILNLPLKDGEKNITQNLAKRILYELQTRNVSQRLFSDKVLGRPANYLWKMLNYPGDWEIQTFWQDKWRQMLNWLVLCESDKSAVLNGTPVVCCEFQTPLKPDIKKPPFTEKQKEKLVEHFKKNANPTRQECEVIGDQIGLRWKQVQCYIQKLRGKSRKCQGSF